MKRFSLLCVELVMLGAASIVAAQPRPLPAVSPEVHPDRTVTFRIPAPNAQSVSVTGDFFGTKQFPMTKDQSGVWSVTTTPIEPDLYTYNFDIDGIGTPDPSNTNMYAAASSFRSMVEIPGDRSAFAAKRDVHHGGVEQHWYHNADLNSERRVLVYMPPGYSTGSESYPVVYLLHGAGADEGSWVNVGRANFIMDNLIAEKRIKPAILVMPFGQSSTAVFAGRGGRGAGRGGGAGGAGGGTFESVMLEKDIKSNVMPLVEREYRVLKDPANRAIMGLSMGGAQTLAIGLTNPQLFSYIGAFSAASSTQALAAPLTSNPEKANKDFKLIYIVCGTNDSLFSANKQFEQILTQAGVKHEWDATADYAHEWTLWRRNFRDTMVKIFGTK